LRNNEGGSIEEVQRVAGLFLPNTLMGYRHFVEGKQEEIRSEKADDFHFDQPIYVLTNKQTAHASELFVAALQFHSRAVIVGERTAGIASENHFYPINHDLFLYVADVQFWLPSKQSWEGVGLEPSIVVRSSQAIAGGKSIDVQLETVLRLINSP
jgi:carboxyl-terminal processing protease